MAALTKTIDGKALGADKFAYVGDAKDISTWHLPIDDDHVESAVKMFGHEQHVPASEKGKVARKIASEAKKHGIDTKDFESKYCRADEHGEHDYAGGWIEIFRAGDYSNQGKAKITREDLTRVVNDYDPDYHEAPVCIGHPESNLPAYAWIDRLKLKGDVLLAKEKQVDPEFADMRKAGKFKKRSAAFYRDTDGNISGLRHVGWLGAQPPAVKGLKNLNFNDADREFVEFEFAQEEAVEKSVKDQIKEFFAEMFGGQRDTATTFSESQVQSIATKAAEAAAKPLQEKVTALEAELKDKTAKFSERETQLAAAAPKQRAVEAINALKGKGRWLPAFEKMGLGLVFDELAKQTDSVEFGEGEAKKKLTPLQLLTQFMEGLPAIVPQGRVVTVANGAAKAKGTGDPLTDMARARATEKKIEFGEALDQIVAENPELAVPGGAQAGAV